MPTQGSVRGVAVEDELCLEIPTMQCTLEEERALLDPSLTQTLAMLNDALLEYLLILSKHIEQMKSTKASQMPGALPSPTMLAGTDVKVYLLIVPLTMVMMTLSAIIFTITTSLGHTILLPEQSQMPMCLPDQAETEQAVRILECINKAPDQLILDQLDETRSTPWE